MSLSKAQIQKRFTDFNYWLKENLRDYNSQIKSKSAISEINDANDGNNNSNANLITISIVKKETIRNKYNNMDNNKTNSNTNNIGNNDDNDKK